jgi:hypothetical protein
MAMELYLDLPGRPSLILGLQIDIVRRRDLKIVRSMYHASGRSPVLGASPAVWFPGFEQGRVRERSQGLIPT